jgi:hypothetical protein
MNYSYQTVAHNTVTVTDPDDTVPAPGKEKPRPIANDGGQRRVGSGWGVEAAPLDLVEWRAKREIYHTGKVERLVEKDGLTIVVADVTPAYTNTDSGDGKFSDRTRRVERFWRTFAYDRVDDVVITFDSVVATEPSFRKRWLLHSIGEPRITPEGFRVHIPPGSRPGRSGGNLEAKVLLPRDASINLVGGRGLEFFVDDRNYDENGKVWKEVKNRPRPAPEPGEWRVEVSPYRDARDDTFLVVLLPTALGVKPEHRVRLLEDGVRVGCEIVGPERTTRWWFDPAVSGPIVEIVDSNGARQHDLRATAPPSR